MENITPFRISKRSSEWEELPSPKTPRLATPSPQRQQSTTQEGSTPIVVSPPRASPAKSLISEDVQHPTTTAMEEDVLINAEKETVTVEGHVSFTVQEDERVSIQLEATSADDNNNEGDGNGSVIEGVQKENTTEAPIEREASIDPTAQHATGEDRETEGETERMSSLGTEEDNTMEMKKSNENEPKENNNDAENKDTHLENDPFQAEKEAFGDDFQYDYADDHMDLFDDNVPPQDAAQDTQASAMEVDSEVNELEERINQLHEAASQGSNLLKKALRLSHLHIAAIDKIAQETMRNSK